MTVEEVVAIKEKMSLETIGMSTNQLHNYHAEGAIAMHKIINEIRAEHRNPPDVQEPLHQQSIPSMVEFIK